MAAALEAIETVWTQERVERLKEFWASGMSAALIARALGVTRSAVIGKVHRLNLPERPTLSSLASRRSEKIAVMQEAVALARPAHGGGLTSADSPAREGRRTSPKGTIAGG